MNVRNGSVAREIAFPFAVFLVLSLEIAGAASICADDDNLTCIENGSSLYPFHTIQIAIDNATSGDSILVAAGQYLENIAIQDNSLLLLGGYIGGTSGSYAGGAGGNFTYRNPDLYTSLVSAADTTEASVRVVNTIDPPAVSGTIIDGFTIRAGCHGIQIDDDVSWPPVDGITISNNILENNGVADGSPDFYNHEGGGIYVSGTNITIRGNHIMNNTAGRGAGIGGGAENLLMEENLIEYNVAFGDHGGGMYISGSTVISSNTIQYNEVGRGAEIGYGWGGGMLILGTAVCSYNVIRGNLSPSPGGGVFVDEGAHASLIHELIYDNHSEGEWASGGAAIYVDGGMQYINGEWVEVGSTLELLNCTIAFNTSPGTNGGNSLYVEGHSRADALNSIFWGNGDDFYTGDTTTDTISVSYCITGESIAGPGNLQSDPYFADIPGDDYHVRSVVGRWDPLSAGGTGSWIRDGEHSPAIDAGDPEAIHDQETVPHGFRVNCGAFGNTPEASRSCFRYNLE